LWTLWARSHNSNKLDNYKNKMDFSWKQFQRRIMVWGKIKNNYEKLSYAVLSIYFPFNQDTVTPPQSCIHSLSHSFIHSVIHAYDDAFNAGKGAKTH